MNTPVFLVLLNLSFFAFGQPKHKQRGQGTDRLRIGGRIGSGLAAFQGKVIQGVANAPVLDITLGGTCAYSLGTKWSIVTELLYATVGNRQSGTYSPYQSGDQKSLASSRVNTHYRLHYVQIPILLKFHIPLEREQSPAIYLNGGLYAQTLLAARYTDFSNGYLSKKGENVRNAFQSFDYGIVVGTGVDLPTDYKGRYLIELRYTLGLRNAMPTPHHEDIFNSALYLSMAYIF